MIRSILIFALLLQTSGLGGTAGIGGAGSIGGGFTSSAIPTIVQSCHNAASATGGTLVCTMGSNITTNNALVACAQWNQNDTTTMTVNGGTSVSIFNKTWDFQTQCYMIAAATGGSTTITATFGATARNRIIIVSEIANLSASPVDQSDTSVFTSGTAMTSGTITPTLSGELVLALFNASNSGPTMTATAPFTAITNGSDFTTNPMMLAFQLQTSAVAVSASGTLSSSSDYIVPIFSLKHI